MRLAVGPLMQETKEAGGVPGDTAGILGRDRAPCPDLPERLGVFDEGAIENGGVKLDHRAAV